MTDRDQTRARVHDSPVLGGYTLDGDQTVAELILGLLDEVDRLEARLAVAVPMLPVETLYRSIPVAPDNVDTLAAPMPGGTLLRFDPPTALVPLEAHRQQGSDTVDPAVEGAPSASAYRYVTPWQETHP